MIAADISYLGETGNLGETIKFPDTWDDDLTLKDLKGAQENELLSIAKSNRISKRIPLPNNNLADNKIEDTLPGQFIRKRDFLSNQVTASFSVSQPNLVHDNYVFCVQGLEPVTHVMQKVLRRFSHF